MGFFLILLTVLLVIVIGASYICFRIAFYAPKKEVAPGVIETPEGEIYDEFRDSMVKWILDARAMNPQEFSIISHDGLKLCAKFYEYAPGAPIELMFHGYRGSAERDLSGGMQRCCCPITANPPW